MEPAILACGAAAALSLGWWLVARAGSSAPSRAIATAVLAAVGFTAVPTPSAADPMPPIVRLAEERTEPPVPDAGAHVVQRGDSLWCIAVATLEDRTGRRPSSAAIAWFWPRIYAANQAAIGHDPNLILAGQRLTIPEP